MAAVYIAGTGYYHPEHRLTNADLMSMVDTTDEWIQTRTGISERRKAPEDVNTSDLGVHATQRALEDAAWKGEQLDLLVCATSTPDSLIPATASYIAKKLEIEPVAFDVNAACSGFVYGLAVGQSLMQTAGYSKVAICTAEKYTRVTDYSDRRTCIFFGDSAGTVLLQHEAPQLGAEVVDLVMANINEGAEWVTTPVGGHFWQDGARVKEYALRGFTESAKNILERNSLKVSDLKAFMGHQANYRVLQTVGDMLSVHESQHWHNVRTCGNQGAAGVITTFCEGVKRHATDLKDGDLILLTVFGSGFTTGSTLLRWIDKRS